MASLPPAQRLRRIARITRLFVSEVVGTVAMAPYGKISIPVTCLAVTYTLKEVCFLARSHALS